MVDTYTVAVNDNLSKIIQHQRGVPPVEIHAWLAKVQMLNPHISNPDRIHPNEQLLIPNSLHESVSDVAIWQNALSHVPPKLGHRPPMNYEIPVQVIMPGDTIDRLATQAFAENLYCSVPESVKRAVFLHNNPRLRCCVGFTPMPGGTLANMTPFMLPEHDVLQWEVQHPVFKIEYDQLRPNVQSVYTTIGPTPTYLIGQTVKNAKAQGAAVGMEDVVPAAASSYVSASSMAMNQVGALIQEVTNDAVTKFGRGVVCSNKVENLRKIERFLKSHPKYNQLMRYLKDLPKHLIPETNVSEVIATTKSPYANARLMRQQVFMPTLKPSGTKYMGTIRSALNSSGRVIKVASRGMAVVPIVMGVFDVAQAPPELRMRTLFEAGFGIFGGYIGAELGGALGGAIAFSILGLGPLGFFIAVFIGASVVGLTLSTVGKNVGGDIYEYSESLGNGQVFFSINNLLESIP